MDRTERQKLCLERWKASGGNGILELATGVGKTYTAFLLINSFIKKYPDFQVIVSVPTSNLKDQWMEYVIRNGLLNNVFVYVINTLITMDIACDLLVVDEIHIAASPQFIQVFNRVKHRYMLGLTGSLVRADDRHLLLLKYYPVVDTITVQEATKNNWLSSYKEFLVLLDVDLSEYEDANREFYEGFEFFGKNFDMAMKARTDYKYRYALAKKLAKSNSFDDIANMNKTIIINASKFGKGLQRRKDFIANHPKKIELANKIIAARQDQKIIVFCHTVKLAEKINAMVYSGKDTGKKGRVKLEEFVNLPFGACASSKKLIAGFDCPDLSVLVDLDINSSKIRKIQSVGRIIRLNDNKQAEVFILVLKGTQEEFWYLNSKTSDNYYTIDEDNLIKVLNGEEFDIKKNREIRSQHWQ